MSKSNLKKAWLSLPSDARENDIADHFISELLDHIGFEKNERIHQCPTGRSTDTVDIAARKNTESDNFLHSKKDPSLIIELKNRSLNLQEGSSEYKKVVKQLRRYLQPSAKNCLEARWGIITNANHIQLFRRHGKLIFPYTQNIELTADNVEEKIEIISKYINKPQKALTVAVYNNKGGVGKTTSIINLAGFLSLLKKKVLVIDFDPNQQDLTKLLRVKPQLVKLFDALSDRKKFTLQETISTYKLVFNTSQEYGFDVVPADDKFLEVGLTELTRLIPKSRLRSAIDQLKNDYDYIFIDSPPNWLFFSQEAVGAADVVLIPSKHSDLSSIENAAVSVASFFPKLGNDRRQFLPELADPYPLPIFFNGGPSKISDAQKLQVDKAIKEIMASFEKPAQVRLLSVFFPKWTKITKNTEVFELPSYANISNAAFSRRPAVFASKVAREQYKKLAKEYFL